MHANVIIPVPSSLVTKSLWEPAERDKGLQRPVCCKALRLLSTSAVAGSIATSFRIMLAKLDTSYASRKSCKHRTAQPLQVINEFGLSLPGVGSLISLRVGVDSLFTRLVIVDSSYRP